MSIAAVLWAILCLVIGVFIGRYSAQGRWPPRRLKPLAHQRYRESLDQHRSQQPDRVTDALVTNLDVTSETLETHFALGALWRRRGEVERAIRIHQNVLTRAGLAPSQLQQAQLELALDYSQSGLLDRAEALLQELCRSTDLTVRQQALQELIYVFQEEREWEKAIHHAELLYQSPLGSDKTFWCHLQAHYCCELAKPFIENAAVGTSAEMLANHELAEKWLTKAQRFTHHHIRTRLLLMELTWRHKKSTSALSDLKSLCEDGRYWMVILPTLRRMCDGDETELAACLTELYRERPNPALVPFVAQSVYLQYGNYSAWEFIEKELLGHEQFAAIGELLAMSDKNSLPFERLKPLLDSAFPMQFKCGACGFEGREFYWCCPACKTWL